MHVLTFTPRVAMQPRPYQREALRAWLANGGRGVVVLPTGSGKTIVAFMALEQIPVRALVVVPTIYLWVAKHVEPRFTTKPPSFRRPGAGTDGRGIGELPEAVPTV